MYRRAARIAFGLVSSLSFSGVLLAAPPSIVTKPLSCVAKDRNPRITARIQGKVKSVRVVFRSVEPKCDEYFVDMRQSASDPTLYWAVLPLSGSETRAISYQVRVDPGNGEKVVMSPSEPLVVPVQNACVADPLSATEQRAADSITLGLLSSTQTGAPCGFQCKGVTTVLTAANELRSNEACFRALAGKPWYMTKNGQQAIGAGAVLLGGAFLWNERRQDNDRNVPSPARP